MNRNNDRDRDRGNSRFNRGDRETEKFRKVFIGCLTSNVDDAALKAYFEQFGEILDVVVMVDKNTGRSRNFGFVTFPTEECVDAVQAARPHRLDGREIETQRAIPKDAEHAIENNQKCNRLFVGGLKLDVTEDQLRDYFSEIGTVEKAEVITWRESGKSRGFAFVTFTDYDSVDKAILHNPHKIGESQSMCKKALSKEEMSKLQNKVQQMRFERDVGFNSMGSFGGRRGAGFGAAGAFNDDFGGRGGGFNHADHDFGGGGGGIGGRGFGSHRDFGGYDDDGFQDNFMGRNSRFTEAMSSMANFGSYGRQNMGGGIMKQDRFGGAGMRSGNSHPYGSGRNMDRDREGRDGRGFF